MPQLGLALTKKAVNQAEDLQGLQTSIDSAFGLHHVAHAHNAETSSDHLAGTTPQAIRDRLK
jgi:enoyl-CoA hydratase